MKKQNLFKQLGERKKMFEEYLEEIRRGSPRLSPKQEKYNKGTFARPSVQK